VGLARQVDPPKPNQNQLSRRRITALLLPFKQTDGGSIPLGGTMFLFVMGVLFGAFLAVSIAFVLFAIYLGGIFRR
jgi:hypothetical protein